MIGLKQQGLAAKELDIGRSRKGIQIENTIDIENSGKNNRQV